MKRKTLVICAVKVQMRVQRRNTNRIEHQLSVMNLHTLLLAVEREGGRVFVQSSVHRFACKEQWTEFKLPTLVEQIYSV